MKKLKSDIKRHLKYFILWFIK